MRATSKIHHFVFSALSATSALPASASTGLLSKVLSISTCVGIGDH